MAPNVLYTSCVLGAIALYMLLRPAGRAVKGIGVILGLGALGWLVKASAAALGAGGEPPVQPFYVVFSLIAVAAAIRMITHDRPVYAALYFVMVVLSSAGLFLLLEAEFMAFALVIVYAGAILITYLFVLMLAQQAPEPGEESFQAEYDVVPREPAAAVTVGFVMLALLGDTVFNGTPELPLPPAPDQVRAAAWQDLEVLPDRVESVVRRERPDVVEVAAREGLRVEGDGAYVSVLTQGSLTPVELRLPDSAMPENIERVGLALIARFPVSLELAGVILLLAMYGAVVLARRQIELSEQEKRRAGAGP